MAFTNAWDEAAPAGSVAANTLDSIVQALKLDLRERLQDAFPDWTDDAVDPKKVVIHSDVAANRPIISLANAGEGFLATDTDVVSFYNGTAWFDIGGYGAATNYFDANGIGSKSETEGDLERILMINFVGTTDGSGDVVIDFGEIDIVDQSQHLRQIIAIVGSDAFTWHPRRISSTATTMTVRVYDHAGVASTTTAVQFYVILGLT